MTDQMFDLLNKYYLQCFHIDHLPDTPFDEEKIRKELESTHSYDSQRYLAIREFLESSEEIGSYLRQALLTANGEPLQNSIYKTIILNMPDLNYESLVHAGAELYYYQNLLNRKLGRTCLSGNEIDYPLLQHIYEEMVFCFPSIRDISLSPEWYADVHRTFFRKYQVIKHSATTITAMKYAFADYLNQYYPGDGHSLPEFLNIDETWYTDNTDNCLDTASSFYQRLRINFHKNETEHRHSDISSENRYKQVLGVSRKASFRDRLPTKDELYMLCIAMYLPYSEFIALRKCCERELQDSTIYADNDYSPRDAIIQSVILNLDSWYERVVEHDSSLSTEFLPQRVLRETDRLLKENHCSALYGR